MPPRKPARPVVVDGIEWLGVVRPDMGRVPFYQAVKTLMDNGVGFSAVDLEPEFFRATDQGTYERCAADDVNAFVGWVLP